MFHVTLCGKKCLELVKLVARDPCQLIYAAHALDSSLKLLGPVSVNSVQRRATANNDVEKNERQREREREIRGELKSRAHLSKDNEYSAVRRADKRNS